MSMLSEMTQGLVLSMIVGATAAEPKCTYQGPSAPEVLQRFDLQTILACTNGVTEIGNAEQWRVVGQCLKVEAITQTGQAAIWYLLELVRAYSPPPGGALEEVRIEDVPEIADAMKAVNRELAP